MAARSVCVLQDALVAAARQLQARNDDARLLLLLLALRLLLGRRRGARLGGARFGLRLRLCFGLGLLQVAPLRAAPPAELLPARSRRLLGSGAASCRSCFRGSRFRFRAPLRPVLLRPALPAASRRRVRPRPARSAAAVAALCCCCFFLLLPPSRSPTPGSVAPGCCCCCCCCWLFLLPPSTSSEAARQLHARHGADAGNDGARLAFGAGRRARLARPAGCRCPAGS